MPVQRARVRTSSSTTWHDASVSLAGSTLEVVADGVGRWSWRADTVAAVHEVAPFDREPSTIEVVGYDGIAHQVQLPGALVAQWCAALSAAVAHEASVEADATTSATAIPAGPVATPSGPWWRVAVAASLLLVLLGVVVGGDDVGEQRRHRQAAAASTGGHRRTSDETAAPTSGSMTSSSDVSTTATSTTTTTTTVAPSTTSPPPAPPPPEPTAVAPLTGLTVPASALARNAIVSKIDASAPAMPQVGLDQADIVLEVKIEWGLSRYLAVFHSQQPPVIGPHRSARTTDPDLLSMFGHPLFAFSGANPGVVDRLALTTWKTGVGPGEVPQAWFRDLGRPFPHNLFANAEVLRSRPAPALFPVPRFFFRAPGTPGGGWPVDGMAVSVGATPLFRWDAASGTWHRWIHDREHVVASGAPVAPRNVVVVETFYGFSAADANSPEAVSLGFGRAWVFTDGHVVPGSWTRMDRYAPYDLRDGAGAPITLLPGQTWVVLADGEPVIDPAG